MLQNSYLISYKHTLFIQFISHLKNCELASSPRVSSRYTVMSIMLDMSSPCYSSSLEHKIFSIPSSSSPDSFTLRNHLPKPSAQQLGVPDQIYVFQMFRKRHLQPQQEVWYVETIPFCSFRLSNKSGRIHSSHGMQEGQTSTVHSVEDKGEYFFCLLAHGKALHVEHTVWECR